MRLLKTKAVAISEATCNARLIAYKFKFNTISSVKSNLIFLD